MQENYSDITEEIGTKEGEYIREYKPILNTQIPNADNWHKFDVRRISARDILSNL